MSNQLYVTADWSRFVREDNPEARFGVAPVDIDRLGLREAYERFIAPEPVTPKEAPKPADKALHKSANK
jgi:hypothetical protein